MWKKRSGLLGSLGCTQVLTTKPRHCKTGEVSVAVERMLSSKGSVIFNASCA